MSTPLTFLQNSFIGGLNQQIDGSRLQSNEYGLLINGRSRFDVIEQTTNPVNVTLAGWTKIQGGYAAGSLLLVFADGKAYYRDFSVDGTTFIQVPDFQMSATADVLYACLVPSSTINGLRKLNASLNSVEGPILLTGTSSASPQAVIVQDGINQPWIIFPNGTARVSLNYNQWSVANREYIPIGKQMLWHDGILYIVSPDGLQIYRSVTGRPMDFMVIIKADGDKEALEADGGAAAISHKVDYSPITAIGTLNSPDGDFYVSTARTSYSVRPTFDITPYGEPYFSNFALFSTGAVNQFSICDILGDYAVIDYSGIRSFNAVQQFRIEGRNAPFSSKISKLLAGIKQEHPASITFDNYGLFAVETIFGRGIMVFDTLTRQWTSLDLFEELKYTTVKMFAEIKTSVTRRLFAITEGAVYELYSEDANASQVGYYSPEFSSTDPGENHKPVLVQLSFLDVIENGSCYLTLIGDELVGTRLRRSVGFGTTPVVGVTPPVVSRNTDKTREVAFYVFDRARTSWKTGLYVQWSFPGKLASVKMIANSEKIGVPLNQQVNEAQLNIIALSVSANEAGAFVNLFGAGMASLTCLEVNGISVTAYTVISDNWIEFTLPDSWSSGQPVILVRVCTESEVFVFSMLASSVALSDNPDFTKFYTPAEVIASAGSDAYTVVSDIVNDRGTYPESPSNPLGDSASAGTKQIPQQNSDTDPSDPTAACAGTLFTLPILSLGLRGNFMLRSASRTNSAIRFSVSSTPGYLVDVSHLIPAAERTQIIGGVSTRVTLQFGFTINDDGSLTFIGTFGTGVTRVRGVSSPTGSVIALNDYMALTFNGWSFCFLNGSIVPTPTPIPDPCDVNYLDTINIYLSGMAVDTGAASMNDPYVTLTKSTVNGLVRYTGYGGDFTFTGLGGFHTNATIIYRKDYPGYPNSWVLDVTFDTIPSGSANGYGIVDSELIDACNMPSITPPVQTIGHIEGSLSVVFITIS